MLLKRYQYWSKEGKKWTKWFPWNNPDFTPEIQLNDRRIFSRLFNEYKEDENICTNR